jgi:hypothetical protein
MMKSGKSVLWPLLGAALLLGGCGRDHDEDGHPASAAEHQVAGEGNPALTQAQMQLMGLKLATLTLAPVQDQLRGQAQVLGHEGTAQLLADIAAAQAAVQQSAAGLQRARTLDTTPGALGTDVLEQAVRQASADTVQLQLAQRRLSAQLGALPWRAGDATLEAVAEGRSKLVQVVMPGGLPQGKGVSRLQFASLDDAAGSRRWVAAAQWSAPVTGGISGASLLALVNDAGLAEGMRLVAIADVGTQSSALVLPVAALLVHDGESWCYVQTAEGQFQRRRVDTSHPLPQGYAVQQGFTTGEQVVVQGAGLLLAREFGQEAGEP